VKQAAADFKVLLKTGHLPKKKRAVPADVQDTSKVVFDAARVEITPQNAEVKQKRTQ